MGPGIAPVDAHLDRVIADTEDQIGALHEGHMTLVRAAREKADRVVVSIFVNPRQFGEGEDLDAYPRQLAQDSAKLVAEGVALLWAPGAEAMSLSVWESITAAARWRSGDDGAAFESTGVAATAPHKRSKRSAAQQVATVRAGARSDEADVFTQQPTKLGAIQRRRRDANQNDRRDDAVAPEPRAEVRRVI